MRLTWLKSDHEIFVGVVSHRCWLVRKFVRNFENGLGRPLLLLSSLEFPWVPFRGWFPGFVARWTAAAEEPCSRVLQL